MWLKRTLRLEEEIPQKCSVAEKEGNQLKKKIKGQMLVRDVKLRMKSDIYDLGESSFY